MTTNKPEVVATIQSKHGDPEAFGERELVTRVDMQALAYGADLIRLSDYEALQAECEKLCKHLQNLIDQAAPLEPVPCDPMWSRRIQLDEVIAERDQLQAECERLRKDAERYRWLRDSFALEGDAFSSINGWLWAGGDFQEVSDAIDAALQEPTQ